MDFAQFDTRHYPTLSVEEGYAEWAPSYDRVVCDEMDLRLLERIEAIRWPERGRAIDLACGTGRVGDWLKGRGVAHVDGLDLSPEMLARARGKAVYDRLHRADLRRTSLPAAAYGLALAVLADGHIEDLRPLYREAARVTEPEAFLVIVGYHPHFMMKGIPSHFDRADGESVAITTHVHLLSDHAKAAHDAGWLLVEMDEGVVDGAWIGKRPGWKSYRNQPVSFCFVWQNAARQ